MPWRGPEVPGEYPTLGYLVGEYIESNCVIPDGPHLGEPFRLTDEMWRFLLSHYRIKPTAVAEPHRPSAPFAYRGSQLVRPQKWGKGPFASAVICAEADEFDGPVLFDGWDADGEPVGRPWPSPWVQVTAVSEDQTANIWRALVPMIELGPLRADIPDTGQTRINLPGGGLIEPVTASAKSRLGQRITLGVQDETHSWTKRNGGRELADNQRRNLAGMGGRWIETTNAWDPNEESVAQQTHEAPVADIYRDYADPGAGSIHNKRELRRLLRRAYGDSWWVDLDRIEADVQELKVRDPAQAERFFCNRIVASADKWMPEPEWQSQARPDVKVDRGEMITVGFDGSEGSRADSTRVPDSTVLIGCRVSDGHLFPLGVWEADGKFDWEPPRLLVDRRITWVFATYNVLLFYGDPPGWQTDIARWAGRFGRERVLEWWTNRDVYMARALERLHTDIITGEATHSGSNRVTKHFLNAYRHVKRAARDDPDNRRERVLVRKRHSNSPDKIDSVPAAALAYEARADAITRGLDKGDDGPGQLIRY